MTSGAKACRRVDESRGHRSGTGCITTGKTYLRPLICEGLPSYMNVAYLHSEGFQCLLVGT